ncbi:MAG: ribosome maturation factor RimM [Anaerolineae bacterium]|nr:ribosome maturation factor RimM [Anaerolineae bacterium]MCI0608801.1 ribosome maturation factor RimM [Anaerolineae bacterium]
MAGKKNTPGSPDGEPGYLTVGFLRRPHGVHGEIIMDLHTDFPERMKSGRKFFVGDGYQPITLTNVRPHQSGLLVKFKDIETPEDAGQLRNQWVYIKAKDAQPLPEGQIYQHELFGFRVMDENDNQLGELVEIIETGANDVYVIKDDSGKEILLPAIPSVILDFDPARRLMRVHLLEGL